MRFWAVSLLVSFTSLLLCLEAKAAEVIHSFDVVAKANKDASLDITEKIAYDFGTRYRHGILRNIPVAYSRYGAAYTIDLRLVDVKDESGNQLPVKVARNGRDIDIRIGDPDVTVTGQHVYNIHYILRRALNFFEGAPEFYWNVTGSQSPVPIERATFMLYPPPGCSANQVRVQSYHGRVGSSQEHAQMRVEAPAIMYSCYDIQPGQDFTVVAGFPKGSISQPTFWQELRYWLADWWPALGLPLAATAFVWLFWWNYGRDAAKLGSIPVEWNPPTQMTPAEVGTLIDESCDMQDIVATLIDLAARGHLRIREIQKGNFFGLGDSAYEFIKSDPPADDPPLRGYEKVFLDGVFGYDAKAGDTKYLSDLKYNFYSNIYTIRSQIYGALTEEQYFVDNPDTVRKQYQALGIFGAFIGILLVCGSGALNTLPAGLGLLGGGAIIAGFAFIMPARTVKGITALRQCLGFARFVDKAEKRRIEVLAQEDPTIFGRLLPYAMVLGFADKWADKFKDLMTEPPDWYQPYGYGYSDYVFSPSMMVNDLGYGMRSMQSVMLATPPTSSSSDGTSSAWSGGSGFDGGFSGGGFGGGGTSSW